MWLNNNLKFVREREKLTQSEFGSVINYDRSLVSKYEKDGNSVPFQYIYAVCKNFKISMDDIVDIDMRKLHNFYEEFPQKKGNEKGKTQGNLPHLSAFKEINQVEEALAAYGEGKIKHLTPVPFYDLDITAGDAPTITSSTLKPDNYYIIPKTEGILAFLPIRGNSMQPIVNNGDIIGIKPIQGNFIIDTSKIYLIITPNNRMIKYLEPHSSEKNTFWCISPNFAKFKIKKSDIQQIYMVALKITHI